MTKTRYQQHTKKTIKDNTITPIYFITYTLLRFNSARVNHVEYARKTDV